MGSSENRRKVALITGASSGIGNELAHLHAARGGDLVVVARSEQKLSELATELRRAHSCRVTVIARDLTRPFAAREVYDAVKAAGIEVDYLINNAGFGGAARFTSGAGRTTSR